jgi:phage terminase small subunit
MNKKLTDKQQRFVDEYLIDLNATQAAIRAGYSEKTADVIGCENLGKPNIAQKIAERKRELAKEVAFDQNKARQMYMLSFKMAKEQSNSGSMISATSALCKLYGVNEPEKQSIQHGINENTTGFSISVKKVNDQKS